MYTYNEMLQAFSNLTNNTSLDIEKDKDILLSSHDTYWIVDCAKKMGKRFIKAESRIAKDGICSFNYAFDVIKGRFILGEEAIRNDQAIGLWNDYATFILATTRNDFNVLLNLAKEYGIDLEEQEYRWYEPTQKEELQDSRFVEVKRNKIAELTELFGVEKVEKYFSKNKNNI